MLRMIRICFNRIWTTFWRKSVRNCQNFHVKKCKIMALTEKKHLYISSFTLNSYRLDEVKEFKDLGVITNEYLSWNSHFDNVVAKAYRILGLLKRTC